MGYALMITMLYGYPGGGKSYYAVAFYIIAHLKKGKHVYSSLAGFDSLRAGVIHGIDPSLYHPLAPENLTPWLDVPDGATETLFVLDEVQNLYGSSNFKDHPKQRELLKQYLSTHRHRGDAVVAICQEPTTVDKFFRDLTEHYVELRKLNMMFGEHTNTFSAIHRKGGTSKSNKVIKQETLKYEDSYTICYQSTLPGAEETKTKSDKIKVNPLRYLWPIFVVLALLGISLFFFIKFRHKSDIPKPDSFTLASTNHNSNKIGPDVKSNVNADGWNADSLCVHWLYGSAEVAKSCPDIGERSGVLPCRLASGDSCYVDVRAGEVARSSDSKQNSEMEPSGSGYPRRDSTPSRSPMSAGPRI